MLLEFFKKNNNLKLLIRKVYLAKLILSGKESFNVAQIQLIACAELRQ